MLRLIGLHPGPDIYLPVAASLAAVPSAQARTILAELTRAHLLSEYTPRRYWFHDLLRTYAAEQAASKDTTRDRHAATHRALDYYLHIAFAAERRINPGRDPIVPGTAEPGALVEQFTSEEQAWQWFINERASLLAAIGQAVRQGLDTHAWQLPWATASRPSISTAQPATTPARPTPSTPSARTTSGWMTISGLSTTAAKRWTCSAPEDKPAKA